MYHKSLRSAAISRVSRLTRRAGFSVDFWSRAPVPCRIAGALCRPLLFDCALRTPGRRFASIPIVALAEEQPMNTSNATASVDGVDTRSERARNLKILCYVPAYNAAATIPSVLDRIPATMRDRIDEILVVDNAS